MKKLLKELAAKEPWKYYPVHALEEYGFTRKRCKICGRYFWTKNENREICGDHEPYGFLNLELVKKKLSYKEVWFNFSKFLEKRGYAPIKRYPVVARWRDDLDFVIASIADFQPYVVRGEVNPPAKKLTVPQFCLRFTDIDNVGLTSRHYTGFIMIGQHAFVEPKDYDINQYFKDLFDWFLSLGIPEGEFVLHEDAWAGGGNAGTSIEFFVRGLELANQVYMQFETINGEIRELRNTKVLDMGMGQERVAWFINRTPTSYDSVFPSVISYLKKNINTDLDYEFLSKFIPYSYSLNVEDVDVEKAYRDLAAKLGYSVEEFLRKLKPFVALYAVSEHTRSLLVAISDGALPSNIGGGYNLRVIFRRAYDLFEKYFNGDFLKLFELHVKEFSGFYDDLCESLDVVEEVIKYEIERYKESKRKIRSIIQKYKKKEISEDKLFELYISYGIRPEDLGIKPPIAFYTKLVEFRERSKRKAKKSEIRVAGEYPSTKLLYYEDWKKKINVVRVLGTEESYVIFDSTIFYPTGGGQANDTGWLLDFEEFEEVMKKYSRFVDTNTIEQVFVGLFGQSGLELLKILDIQFNSSVSAEEEISSIYSLRKELEKLVIPVTDVIKFGQIVLHKVEDIDGIKDGKKYLQILNWERRLKLTKYHDAIHILNGALRKYYGKIIWQAGAEKAPDKARLDVTYYRLPTEEEIKEIEEMVNRVVWEDRKITKKWMSRDEAEKIYGFTIYQGGTVPGKVIRIVEIENWDVEACGGTHGDSTSYIGLIKIKKVEKIADGIIRFEILVGEDALEYIQEVEKKLRDAAKIARVSTDLVPKTMRKFFDQWKEANKKLDKLYEILAGIAEKGGELKMPDDFSLEDLLKIASKVKSNSAVIIYNNNFIVGKNCNEEEIIKRNYELIRKGRFLIGKKNK